MITATLACVQGGPEHDDRKVLEAVHDFTAIAELGLLQAKSVPGSDTCCATDPPARAIVNKLAMLQLENGKLCVRVLDLAK